MTGPICREWMDPGEPSLATIRIPGCDPVRICGRPATHEFKSPINGGFGCLCERHIRAWAPALCRELTARRRDAHELDQWREGILTRQPKG